LCVPFFIYLKWITFFKVPSKTGCIRVHFRISVFRGYSFLNVYGGAGAGFQRPFVFKSIMSGKRETRQETIRSAVLVCFFTITKGHMVGYYILHYMAFFCHAETSLTHKPRGKAIFSDFFFFHSCILIYFFDNVTFYTFIYFYQSSLVTEL